MKDYDSLIHSSPDAVAVRDVYLVNLYQMVKEIKEDLMDSLIVYGSPKCYIEGEDMEVECDGEGYVIKNDYYGWFKLVRREEFSYANFTQGKFS